MINRLSVGGQPVFLMLYSFVLCREHSIYADISFRCVHPAAVFCSGIKIEKNPLCILQSMAENAII